MDGCGNYILEAVQSMIEQETKFKSRIRLHRNSGLIGIIINFTGISGLNPANFGVAVTFAVTTYHDIFTHFHKIILVHGKRKKNQQKLTTLNSISTANYES